MSHLGHAMGKGLLKYGVCLFLSLALLAPRAGAISIDPDPKVQLATFYGSVMTFLGTLTLPPDGSPDMICITSSHP